MSSDNELDKYIAEHLKKCYPARDDNGRRLFYHYTTVDTLEVLTRRKADMMCTYCGALNDRSEFVVGIELIKKYMKHHPKEQEIVPCDVLDQIASDPSCAAWSMSFSLERDSLSQWTSYTDRTEGGVAIGFDMDRLNEKIHACKKCGLMYLVPCLYVGADDSEIDGLLRFLFGSYRRTVSLALTAKHKVPELDVWRGVTATLALIFAAMVKEGSFRDEHEWRLVMQTFVPEIVRDCEFVGGKPRLRTGLFGDHFRLAQDIVDIICSPHGHLQSRVKMISALRQLSIKPQQSASSYNG